MGFSATEKKKLLYESLLRKKEKENLIFNFTFHFQKKQLKYDI